MFYTYLLRHRTNRELYYGYTNNIERRTAEHGKDWELLYFEAYYSEVDARERERKLKHYGQARTHLKNRLKKSLG